METLTDDDRKKAKIMAKHSVNLFKAGFHTCKTKKELITDMEATRNRFDAGARLWHYYDVQLTEIKKLLK